MKVRRIVAGSIGVASALSVLLGTGTAGSRLPRAGVVVGTVRVPITDTVLQAAFGQSLYALVLPEQGGTTPITVMRIAADGRVATRRLQFGLAYFLSDVSVGPDGLYAGTYVVKRFKDVPDELIRIDPATLGIAARAYFPMRVRPFAAGGSLWASVADGRVVRLDPKTLAMTAVSRQIAFSPELGTPPYLSTPALGFRGLWVLTSRSRNLQLLRLDPVTLAVTSSTSLPVRLAQFGGGLVADPHHLFLAGDVVGALDATGKLSGRLVSESDPVGWFQIYGSGLVGIVSHGTRTEIVLLDAGGRIRARTALPGGGSWLTVSGDDAWLVGNVGQGNGIVHVRLDRAA